MSLLWRRFRPDDQEAVRALILAGLGQRFETVRAAFNPDLDDIQASYVEPGGTVLVVEAAGAIVACGMVIAEAGQPGVARIVRMSVREDHQGRGLGYAMGRRLLDAARAAGYGRVLVETNADWESALRLYHGIGFSEYARTPSPEFGFIEVHMALTLDEAHLR